MSQITTAPMTCHTTETNGYHWRCRPTKSALLAILRNGGKAEMMRDLFDEAAFNITFGPGSRFVVFSEYSNECNSDIILADGTRIGGEQHLFIRRATWEESIAEKPFTAIDTNTCRYMKVWQAEELFKAICAEANA